MLRTRTRVPWAPGASTPRLGFLQNSKDRPTSGCIEKAQILRQNKRAAGAALKSHPYDAL
jgi:hypothetical protein